MKKFTGCFLIACLMVVNLLVVPLPTAQAVTVGNLQMNPSHNWLGGNNFVQDADLSVIINDGTPIAV